MTTENEFKRCDVKIQSEPDPFSSCFSSCWSDMATHEKSLESPAWHTAILNDREAALNAGTVTTSNWEEAKERIKKNVS